MKRRDLLKTGALAGLGGLFSFGAHPAGRHSASQQPVRNVIFFAYDGFTWEDVASARTYAKRHMDRSLAFDRLFDRSSAGSMDSSSLTSVTTDSAAASCAWGTGQKIVSGLLNMYPDGTTLEPILRLAQQKGLATGLITTTRLTHATPAGWYAQIDWRRREEDIALQLTDMPPEVLLGGGHRALSGELRDDGHDVYGDFVDQDFTIVRSEAELQQANSSKLLGVFHRSHLPYEIDRRFQGVAAPTLAQMVTKGLEVLSGYDQGFLAQIEAGRIDHANHRNDAGGLLWEVLAADEALAVLMEYVDTHPDTLLIMASDHGTGSGAVYGVGKRYREGSTTHDHITKRTASFPYIIDEMQHDPVPPHVTGVAKRYTGIRMTDEQAALMVRALHGDLAMPNLQAYDRQPYNTLAHCLRGGTYDDPDRLNINFATGQHTAGPVPVAAYGAGADTLECGMVDNTDLYDWMASALDISYRNPSMSRHAAREALAE